jgi:hypothetical protein
MGGLTAKASGHVDSGAIGQRHTGPTPGTVIYPVSQEPDEIRGTASKIERSQASDADHGERISD